MTLIEAALLGLLQGLTEFLPVSSSGHLALARCLLDYEEGGGALFEVAVHVGTALAIMAVYFREIGALLRAAPRLLRPSSWARAYAEDAAFRTIVLILLSAIPAGIVGILFKDEIESLFDQPVVVGCCLLLTGLVLAALRFAPSGNAPINGKLAITMGLAQAVAVLPGISRSGSTIAAGLFASGEREGVGRFAFLMALIPICGAAILKLRDLGGEGSPALGAVAVGTLVAFVSGLFALKLLLRFLAQGRLFLFAPYCFALGLAAIIFGT